jgi:hypothetical protein
VRRERLLSLKHKLNHMRMKKGSLHVNFKKLEMKMVILGVGGRDSRIL